MHGEIVALDLETTGLDPFNDDIIEIGAVRLRDGQIVETWDTLVDPDRILPANITFLTGIRQDDLIGAPKMAQVRDHLAQFIGDAPVLGHNVGFDHSFLSRWDLLGRNLLLDTYELASVLLPTAPRYNLSSLTQQLGIMLDNAHRALADTIATARLYGRLWEKALGLPLNTLQEIINAARGLDWNAAPVFEAALKDRMNTAFDQPQQQQGLGSVEDLFAPDRSAWEVLRPNPAIQPINVDTLAEHLQESGSFSKATPGYEHRPQQIAMLRAVGSAFNAHRHLIVEAGTGTGKSIAYLIPALAWATTNGQRVVISTNTINLQEQLLNKDIPLLQKALGTDFRAAVVKGRGNYLCLRRLAALRRRPPTSLDELRVFAKILIWLQESSSGDRGEISLRGASEISAWNRLSAEDEGCTMDRCSSQMHGACPFYKARRQAESAHLLIVNHALLLSDVAAGNRVLPEYHYVILDEAHHLEDATTNGLSFRIDQSALYRLLADLGGTRRGVLGDLLSRSRGAIPDTHLAQLTEYVQRVEEAVQAMEHHVTALFTAILHFLQENRLLNAGEYVNQVRITPESRSKPGFGLVRATWQTLSQFTAEIADAMQRLSTGLGRLRDYDIPNYEDIVMSVAAASRHLLEVHQQLQAFTNEPDANTIYWVEVGQYQHTSLHAAPLHVGPLLEKHLWHGKDVVVLTSATMQTARSFDYIKDRLNAHEVQTMDVGSPFDYRSSTLVYLPTDMPEPNDRQNYQSTVERTLVELAAATKGRLMGLFTSYTQLRQTAQAIRPRLALGDIAVFDQTEGTSRQALLEGFIKNERAVLLGTRSFWEGVDIPGDDLRVLVIARLPFAVPSDPIVEARSETFENAFRDYSVPDAILRFRQGFGRLIRTKTDRGVVVILDKRVLSKAYGRHFLDSLPDCTVQRKPLGNLVQETLDWIDKGTD